jgi:hypothetical protein
MDSSVPADHCIDLAVCVLTGVLRYVHADPGGTQLTHTFAADAGIRIELRNDDPRYSGLNKLARAGFVVLFRAVESAGLQVAVDRRPGALLTRDLEGTCLGVRAAVSGVMALGNDRTAFNDQRADLRVRPYACVAAAAGKLKSSREQVSILLRPRMYSAILCAIARPRTFALRDGHRAPGAPRR